MPAPTHPRRDFRLMDEPPKGGYVKWFHKSLKHPLFKRYEIWHYFQFCVLRAWWSDEPTRQEISGEGNTQLHARNSLQIPAIPGTEDW